ncbi:MAG: HlyD family efflux transporter periplasmic adaptor subunit [Pseudomonadota bacterium]
MSIDSSNGSLEQALAKVISAETPQELLQSLCVAACVAIGPASSDAGAAILIYDRAGVRALSAFGKHIPVRESAKGTSVPQMPPTWLLALASRFPKILAQTVVDTPLAVGQKSMHSVFVPLFMGESHKVSLALALPKEAFSSHVLANMCFLRVLAQQVDKGLAKHIASEEDVQQPDTAPKIAGQVTPKANSKVSQAQKPLNSSHDSSAASSADSSPTKSSGAPESQAEPQAELATVMHIVSEVQQCQRSFEAAVTFCAMTNTSLNLSRVALATVHDSEVQVFAIDQMEKFLRGTRTVRLMEEAMAECLAQDCAVAYSLGHGHMPFADEHADIATPSNVASSTLSENAPTAANEAELAEPAPQADSQAISPSQDNAFSDNKYHGVVITAAAAMFLRTAGGKSLLCLPLKCQEEIRFIALFIAEHDLSEREHLTLRLASELAVSHLENLAIIEEPLFRRLRRYVKLKLDDCFGPAHTMLKVGMVCIAAFFCFTLMVHDTLELSAPLVVEGVHSYTQTSPVDSYLVEVCARTGDAVKKGDLLGRVDDTHIRLEKTAMETQRKIHLGQAYQYSQEGKEAEASLARLEAQKDTVNLQWAEARIQMTSLYAAVDGFVVSEDMYSRLGQPVRRGQELFEVADTTALRVVMQVPEDDIALMHMNENPKGDFALTAYPDKKIAFTVERIHPFAHVKDGINSFEVRGAVGTLPDDILLRPGMEGLAQIYAGEHCLLYIWTRKILEKITLFWWSL